MHLDKNGQPYPEFNWKNNEIKAVNTLYGLIMGITADGIINDDEISFLNLWLLDNDNYANTFPLNVIKHRINDILADGIITEAERGDLFQTLANILGGTLKETGAAGGLSTGYGAEQPNEIIFQGSTFCLTGAFVTGTRRKCEYIISQLGGIPVSTVNKDLNYLVIGALASRDWAATSHGRKIEKALHYQEKGHPISILYEETWVKFTTIIDNR